MKLSAAVVLLLATSTSAFSPVSVPKSINTQLQAHNDNLLAKAAATACMTAFLWGSPTVMVEKMECNNMMVVPPAVIEQTMASAVEKASGSGSRVNKDADSLLRYALPIKNKEVRKLQENLETVRADVSSKRKLAALDGVKKSKALLTGKTADAMIASCRDAKVCTEIVATMQQGLDPLNLEIKASQEYFTGSEQEREALDKALVLQQSLTKSLTTLEEQMVPEGYETPVPAEYSDLPQLKKRATVEMVVHKADNDGVFNVNGVNFPEAKLTMVIDGYTAPVTGGNFVDLVNKGFYTKMLIQRSDGFVVQTGNPEGTPIGYTGGKASKSIGAGPNGERLIPAEIYLRGDKGPFYEATIEDESRGGEASVLPFSSYGAMGWARDEYDANSGSSQFFWLLFDSDLTPAGKNLLDGRYPCFGYVVEGADFLQDIKEGDVIVSAKVTDGLEYLVQPKD